MPTETFTWERQAGSVGRIEYRIREVKFGDGYSLAVEDGINNEVQIWPITVKGDLTLVQEVRDFYAAHKGAKSFYWTPPGSPGPLLFRAKNVAMTSHGGGVYSISAQFEQVYTT